MSYKNLLFVLLAFAVLVLHFLCSSPEQPDFNIPLPVSFVMFSDSSCTDTLKQGSTLSCKETIYFTLKLDKPHEVTTASLIVTDSIGNQLYTVSKSDILTTDSLVFLDSLTLLYPGTDTVSVTVTSVDTTVQTVFTIMVSGLPPEIGNNNKIQSGGKNIVDSLYFFYVSVEGTKPMLYQWYKDGLPHTSGIGRDTLLIEKLTLSDKGMYTCRVTNDWGSDSSDTFILGIITSSPQILDGKTIHASGVPLLDSSFYLYVHGTGSTPLQYTWSHNGVLIAGADNDTVTFASPLVVTDTGAYVCTLSNIYGKDVSVPYRLTFGNHAPVWNTDTVHAGIYEGERLSLSFTDSCSDPDNDVLTFYLAPLEPAGDTITPQGAYTYTPGYKDAGHYDAAVLAGDGNVFNSCILSLTVLNSNRRPVFLDNQAALYYQIDKGALLTVAFKAVDPDSEVVYYSIGSTTLPRPETIKQSASSLTWQSYASDSGRYTLVLHATDNIDTAVATIDIAIGSFNLPPNITITGYQSGDTMVVNEMDTLTFYAAATDPNPSDLTILSIPLNKPDSAHFDITTGLFTYRPNYLVSSAMVNKTFGNITFTAFDNATPSLSDTFVVHLRVVNVNNAPVLDSIPDTIVYEGDTLALSISATDINCDSISLYADSLPGSAVFIDSGNGSGLLVWQPGYSDSGLHTIIFFSSDGELLDKQPVTITVLDKKYTIISLPTVNGAIIPADTAIIEPESDTVYSIVPNSGYHIDSVLVDGINAGLDSVYTFSKVLANHSIQAFFSINIYRIIKAATSGGYISDIGGTLANDTNWLQHGTAYEINAIAYSGFQFSNWSGAPSVTAAMNYKLQDSARSDLNLRAEFIRTGMVLVPARDSSFSMGQAGLVDPVHTVNFTYNFWMDETEVIGESFQQLMGFNPSFNSGSHNLPVENVSFFDAALYCNQRSKADGLDTVYSYSQKLYLSFACTSLVDFKTHYERSGYRLPTEAEWEYACRGGTTTPYWWGTDSMGGITGAWNVHNSGVKTQPVGLESTKNQYGLYDMAGNVWEKCNDWMDTYPATSQTNPIGPDSSPQGFRAARGSCFLSPLKDLQSAVRGYNVPGAIYYFIGFRVARPQTNPF